MPDQEIPPPVGEAVTLEPGLRRILAPNPSPMTYWGTNTYLLGTQDIAVIDPGPDLPEHQAAIMDAIELGTRISHILVTHGHLDHSPQARPLAQRTGAKIHAFGPSDAGRSAVMRQLAKSGFAGGGEGIDTAFIPDRRLADGERIHGRDWSLEALHTPGHMGNHLCFAWGKVLFSGDHVMGWASSLVSPPDGDLTDFMTSCARLQSRQWRVFYPGHGMAVPDPQARLGWLVRHRKARETSIITALEGGPATSQELSDRIYLDTPQSLRPAAARNIFAHLIDLMGKGLVKPMAPPAFNTAFLRNK